MAVVHLDTNFLIFGSVPAHPAHRQLRAWIAAGDTVSVSAMTWAEYRCGPVTPALLAGWETLLGGRVLAVDRVVAERASDLFNLTGRRSRTLPDCVIAATAMRDNARLATLNREDFERLVPYGLLLA